MPHKDLAERAIYNKAYKEKHKEELKAKARVYYKEHKEEIKAYREKHRAKIATRTKAYHKKYIKIKRYALKGTIALLVTGSRARARRKGLPHSLTKQDVLDMWFEQKGRCALSGFVLMPAAHRDTNPQNVLSIDRIANNGTGYTRGNCRLVSYAANIFRQFHSDDVVLAVARGIVETIGGVSSAVLEDWMMGWLEMMDADEVFERMGY